MNSITHLFGVRLTEVRRGLFHQLAQACLTGEVRRALLSVDGTLCVSRAGSGQESSTCWQVYNRLATCRLRRERALSSKMWNNGESSYHILSSLMAALMLLITSCSIAADFGSHDTSVGRSEDGAAVVYDDDSSSGHQTDSSKEPSDYKDKQRSASGASGGSKGRTEQPQERARGSKGLMIVGTSAAVRCLCHCDGRHIIQCHSGLPTDSPHACLSSFLAASRLGLPVGLEPVRVIDGVGVHERSGQAEGGQAPSGQDCGHTHGAGRGTAAQPRERAVTGDARYVSESIITEAHSHCLWFERPLS